MPAPNVHEERRNRLRARLGNGLALFLGGEEDEGAPSFRQDSTFLYFTGVDRPGFSLLLDLDEGSATLYGDEPPFESVAWSGPFPGIGELASRAGIGHAAPGARLADDLQCAMALGRTIRFLPPRCPQHRLKLFLLFGCHPDHQLLAASVDLVQAIAEQRALKSPEEIEEIERAVDLSVDMHMAAMRMARPGLREAEIAARVAEVALASGGGLACPLVATARGEFLHDRPRDLVLENGRMFLLAAGAETPGHYAGHLSSAFPVNRTFSARQKEVYLVVLAALQAAAAALRPGAWFQEAHLASCRALAEGLRALGLMKGGVEDAVSAGALALFFPHGLGHMLGMDVHDMGDAGEPGAARAGMPGSALAAPLPPRLAREMQPGFVFALEPGLYFMPGLMDRWRAEQRHAAFIDYPRLEPYRNFGGIRLGENHLLTEHGARRLGKFLPRIPGEIEVVRGNS